MTVTLRTRPGLLADLLDPALLRELRSHQLSEHGRIETGATVLEVGAGAGRVTTHLAGLVGHTGTVSAVDRDTNPTGTIGVSARDLDRQVLPGGEDSYDHVVARWPYGALREPGDVLDQLLLRLRPGGLLVLADMPAKHPEIHAAPDDESAALIRHVTRQVYTAVMGEDGTWTDALDTIRARRGLAPCVHRTDETWTGDSPGCRLLADITAHLRASIDVTGDDAERFAGLMRDPRVRFDWFVSRIIQARTAS
ncbi:class I SAM-dependent methyltransferase [Salinispora arenicola]|uniref:class I SAM-dependent methyltransferase n=1 Tax=Salinispora arenicola TaxID=168697 RepID=UPI00036AAB46|nr:methyltransferase domain-containing protein [Salinispora arenicola]